MSYKRGWNETSRRYKTLSFFLVARDDISEQVNILIRASTYRPFAQSCIDRLAARKTALNSLLEEGGRFVSSWSHVSSYNLQYLRREFNLPDVTYANEQMIHITHYRLSYDSAKIRVQSVREFRSLHSNHTETGANFKKSCVLKKCVDFY